MLNVCYNFVNTIDIMQKKYKIMLYIKLLKKGKIQRSMRIISGTARGTKLYTLEGLETRPTLDRVKESIFNIIQNEIEGSTVLDLFSGSGAIGLELLSRGARKAVLCDKSKEAIQIITKNAQKTHLQEKAEIYNMDFKVLIKKMHNQKFDIIYIDPPYVTDYVDVAINEIIKYKLISINTKIIIETTIIEIEDKTTSKTIIPSIETTINLIKIEIIMEKDLEEDL